MKSKNYYVLSLFCLLFFLPTSYTAVNAQIKLGRKTKDVVNKVKELPGLGKEESEEEDSQETDGEHKESETKSTSPTKSSHEIKSKQRENPTIEELEEVRKVQPKMDQHPFPPAVSAWSQFKNTYVHDNKYLLANHLVIFFAPNVDEDGNRLNAFDDYQKMVLSREGQIIDTIVYTKGGPTSVPIKGSFTLDGYGERRWEASKIGPGELTMDYYLGDYHFYTQKEELVELKSNDPYNPNSVYFFKNKRWVVLEKKDNLKVYFKLINERTEKEREKIFWYAVLKRNGAPFATAGTKDKPQFNIVNSPGNMETPSFVFKLNQKRGSDEYVKYDNLPDGDYTIIIDCFKTEDNIKSNNIGVRKYSFKVSDRKILPPAYQDRNKHSNQKTLIEAGPDMIILKE